MLKTYKQHTTLTITRLSISQEQLMSYFVVCQVTSLEAYSLIVIAGSNIYTHSLHRASLVCCCFYTLQIDTSMDTQYCLVYQAPFWRIEKMMGKQIQLEIIGAIGLRVIGSKVVLSTNHFCEPKVF